MYEKAIVMNKKGEVASRNDSPKETSENSILAALGKRSIEISLQTLGLLNFFGEVIVFSKEYFSGHEKIRWKSVAFHIYHSGIRTLSILGLLSFLIGMVLSYQGIVQLSRFGAEIYTVDFLSIGVVREIGGLLAAIIVAGRSGSAYAAQIATMSLNQEIDVLRIYRLNPLGVLVIPRIIGLIIFMPALFFFSSVSCLLGGMMTTALIIDLSPLDFCIQARKVLDLTDFSTGMVKAPFFAIIISIIGCYRGFIGGESAESVGKSTTQSVVESLFWVIVCDAFFAVLFSYFRI